MTQSNPIGEAAGLALFMAEYFEALEADFLRYYGVNLAEALYGKEKIGARRLLALVKGIPPDSAIHRAIANDPSVELPMEEDLEVTHDPHEVTRFFGE